MKNDALIEWLLRGDAAIRWQTMRFFDFSNEADIAAERKKIAAEGWGKRLLALQDEDGIWGGGLYTPKWISNNYTLLLLKSFGLDPENEQAKRGCRVMIERGKYHDGGLNYFKSLKCSETCVTGMGLQIFSYFRWIEKDLYSIVDFLLREQMPDGGWNCNSYLGAVHSSFHTTISVLEAFHCFQQHSKYRRKEILNAAAEAREFLFIHKLFRSHRTGKIFDPKMTRLSFPPRWRYDILRAMEYFSDAGTPYDSRMDEAIEIIIKKRNEDGAWNLQQTYPGKMYFQMEKTGKPSRWNTLRAMKVLQSYAE